MERILLIETSTALCSTALAEDGVITAYRESSAPKAHASLTAVFVQEMLAERGITLSDCDAVCVSKGPGSYTGLRVGVSTAKGLCFGADKPLLAVGTLDTLVAQAVADRSLNVNSDPVVTADHPLDITSDLVVTADRSLNVTSDPVITADRSLDVTSDPVVTADHSLDVTSGRLTVIPDQIGDPLFIIPMIDARRMEVYSAVFSNTSSVIPSVPSVIPSASSVIPSEVEGSPHYIQITETTPVIVDENSFAEYLEQGPVLFIGDGAGKCADVINHPNAHFCQCHPKASSMLSPAVAALRAGKFEDVAYFEPFYLKEFVATISKKKLW